MQLVDYISVTNEDENLAEMSQKMIQDEMRMTKFYRIHRSDIDTDVTHKTELRRV